MLDMMAALDPSKPMLVTTEVEAIQWLQERGYIVALAPTAAIQTLPSSFSRQIHNATREAIGSSASHHRWSCDENWADTQALNAQTTPIYGRGDVADQACDSIDGLGFESGDDDDDDSSSCGGVALPAGHQPNQEGFATNDVAVHENVSPSASSPDPIMISSLADHFNRAKAKQERKDILEEVQCMGLAAEEKNCFLAAITAGGSAVAVIADNFRKTNDKAARKVIRKEVRRLKLGAIFEFALVSGRKRSVRP